MQRLAQDGEIDRPFFNRRIFDVAQPVFEICEAVLAVSFLSLGLRRGLVVALAIPLVHAVTFVALEYLGSSPQRISLGALIIALGLLVLRHQGKDGLASGIKFYDGPKLSVSAPFVSFWRGDGDDRVVRVA